MKVHNGLMQRLGRIILKHMLEIAEGTGGGLKQLRGCGLEAVGIFNERSEPPDLAGAVGVVILSIPGFHQTQGLPHGIAPLLGDDFPEVGGDADEVLHQLLRMGEGCQRQTLQDKTDAVALLRLAQDAEGIIDVPLTIANSTHQRCRKIIGRQNFFQNSILLGVVEICHLWIIPFRFGVKWWKKFDF